MTLHDPALSIDFVIIPLDTNWVLFTLSTFKENQNEPSFSSTLIHSRTAVGGKTILKCAVVVFPNYPEVCWYKDSKVLDEDKRFTFNFDDNGEITLIIDPVTAEDEGYYTCMLKNEFGASHCEAPLTVDGKYLIVV